jgi:hypothetical protein
MSMSRNKIRLTGTEFIKTLMKVDSEANGFVINKNITGAGRKSSGGS